jgi:hypothetical protein
MAVDYKPSAAYDIIKYIWSKIVADGVLILTDYNIAAGNNAILTVVPIIPVQEVPEIVNHIGDKPYLVYDYSMLGESITHTPVWMVSRDELVFSIYSPDQAKIVEIINWFSNEFRRRDESANTVNVWGGLSNNFYFYHTNIISAMASAYTDEESGRMVGEVVLGYDYARNADGDGKFI